LIVIIYLTVLSGDIFIDHFILLTTKLHALDCNTVY